MRRSGFTRFLIRTHAACQYCGIAWLLLALSIAPVKHTWCSGQIGGTGVQLPYPEYRTHKATCPPAAHLQILVPRKLFILSTKTSIFPRSVLSLLDANPRCV